MEKMLSVKLTAAIGVAGQIKVPGDVVSVTTEEAKIIIAGGKGVAVGDAPEVPLNSMKVVELRAIAEAEGVENIGGLNKAELIDAIENARKAEDE